MSQKDEWANTPALATRLNVGDLVYLANHKEKIYIEAKVRMVSDMGYSSLPGITRREGTKLYCVELENGTILGDRFFNPEGTTPLDIDELEEEIPENYSHDPSKFGFVNEPL